MPSVLRISTPSRLGGRQLLSLRRQLLPSTAAIQLQPASLASTQSRINSSSANQRSLSSGANAKMSAKPVQRNARSLATAVQGAGGSAMSPLQSLPPGFEIRSAQQGNNAASSSAATAGVAAPYAMFTRDLEKSLLDDRQYRIVCLSNGLEVLLVHDPKTDKASAAMDIRVGHLSDPEDFQGLAHFCEHLLFMGTEKYPRENEYSEYLSNHSGSSNAYTGMDNTNYFFDVGHAHLEGALDRFSQFFISPLFDASCTEREIRAVDSEHKKNLQADAWRAFQLDKSLSDPKHPYSHFGTGSAKTLWDEPRKRGQDVRDELLRFHDRYYSANVMKLVVLGREPLDQLNDWIVDKFSGVRNKGLAAPTFPESPLGKEQMSTQIFFRTVKDIRMLDVTFPIPDQVPLFRAKPGQFLSHFIGHEGQGSILSYLKKQGWSNHLSAGSTNGADGFEFFKISVDLTKDGLQNYQNVVASIFRYIELLKQSPIPEWNYNEVASLCDLAFRFKEKVPPSSYVSALSTQMQVPYPREWILSGPYLTREFNRESISDTLACLAPERCRITIAAQECPDGSKAWDQKEKWYGTEYKLTPLPTSLLSQAPSSALEELALPNPNTFIPQNFDVAGQKSQVDAPVRPTKRPVLLQHNELSRLWHKTDDQFFLPKANVFTLLRSPLVDATPANAVKSRVFAELLKDALTEYSYDAELAGLGYNIEAQSDGFGISVDGYNDKLAVLMSHILKAIRGFSVDPARFEIVKDTVARAYENFRLEMPYQHANYYTTYLTVERMWTPEEKLKELKQLQAEDVQRFIPELLSRLHIEMLAHGNLTESQSKSLMQLVETTLAPKSLSPSELISPRSLVLPVPSNTRWVKQVADPDNVNSSIEVYCQVGDPTDRRSKATLDLLSQIASEPAFDQLRTKEQLGYIVFSSARKSIGSMGFRVLIQSERDATYLDSRIEAFFVHFRSILENMSPEEFERQKLSLINKKREAVKNLVEESTRFWYHIHSGYYDFLMREADIDNLTAISKADVLAMFMKHIDPSSSLRAKLAVYVESQVKPVAFSVEAGQALQEMYTKGELSGAPQPPQEAWDMLLAGNSTVDGVKDFVRTLYEASEAPVELLEKTNAAVSELAQRFPAQAQDQAKAVEGEAGEGAAATAGPAVVDIDPQDPVTWKAGLTPSKAAQPVRSWKEFEQEPERKEAEESKTVASSSAGPAGNAHL